MLEILCLEPKSCSKLKLLTSSFEVVCLHFVDGSFAFSGCRFHRLGKQNCFERRKQLSFVLLKLPNEYKKFQFLHSNGDYVAFYLPPLLPYCIEFVDGGGHQRGSFELPCANIASALMRSVCKGQCQSIKNFQAVDKSAHSSPSGYFSTSM